MTFGIHGISQFSQPSVLTRNVTINNLGFGGSLFSGMAYGMGLPGAFMPMYPRMNYNMMNAMSTMAMTGLSPMAILNSRAGQTQTISQAQQADTKLSNLKTLFNKCTIVAEGDGMYTARATNGTIVTGNYDTVKDALAKAEAEAPKDKPKDDNTAQA